MGDNLKVESVVSTKGKKFILPKGGEIINNEKRMRVEEIENGFLICNSYEIKWRNVEGENQYEYFDKKWYSKENPITVKTPKDVNLADNF
jgi:hypothetical protein